MTRLSVVREVSVTAEVFSVPEELFLSFEHDAKENTASAASESEIIREDIFIFITSIICCINCKL